MRPALNGCVERAQSSWRYEFYACYDLPARIDKLQPLVDAFAHRYNHHRPLAISLQRISKRHNPRTQPSHKCGNRTLRLDHPMWGKEKLGPILRKHGYATSNAEALGGRWDCISAIGRRSEERLAVKSRPA
jgi:hypothetical protein